MSIPIMLRNMSTLLFSSAGSDTLHLHTKETFLISTDWQNGLWKFSSHFFFPSYCQCFNSEHLSLDVNLSVAGLWQLQKSQTPLNKIPNTSSFVVKDTKIYVFLWGVINLWFQRNNVWCSSPNMRICISLFTTPLEPWARYPVILEVTSVKVLVSFLRSKVQREEW